MIKLTFFLYLTCVLRHQLCLYALRAGRLQRLLPGGSPQRTNQAWAGLAVRAREEKFFGQTKFLWREASAIPGQPGGLCLSQPRRKDSDRRTPHLQKAGTRRNGVTCGAPQPERLLQVRGVASGWNPATAEHDSRPDAILLPVKWLLEKGRK